MFREMWFHHAVVVTAVQELLSYRTNENSSCGNAEQEPWEKEWWLGLKKMQDGQPALVFLLTSGLGTEEI